MEKKEWIEGCKRVFTRLVKDTLWEDFKKPEGGLADRHIGNCYDKLIKKLGSVSAERLADFCICQVYAMTQFHKGYRKHWNISHSFGDKAIERYMVPINHRKKHEDSWLNCLGVTRGKYLSMIVDNSKHPLAIFIYPEYEEYTKRRWMSNELGYLICGTSTLMWTPFSPVCQKCTNAPLCKKRTEHVHHELYRIRCEAWQKRQKE